MKKHWKNIVVALLIFAAGYYIGKNMESSGTHAAVKQKVKGHGGGNSGMDDGS